VTAAKAPLLERLGTRYLRALGSGAFVHSEKATLDTDEKAALRRSVRRAVVRACVAGALSALVSALADLYAQPGLGPDPDYASEEAQIVYWSIVGGATAIASMLEIAFLYWDALRSVHRLSTLAKIDLFASAHDERAGVATALARAALELPSPRANVLGIDPLREASKARLLVASLVYKVKVSATNFLAKLLLRRMLGRALVRAWLPLVAVPFTAAWNGIVCFMVLREARLRAEGLSSAREAAASIFEGAPELSDEARAACLRAVASAIVRTRDMHPNLVLLYVEVRSKVGDLVVVDVDDTRRFLHVLAALSEAEKRLVYRVLEAAVGIDGRVAREERRLLAEARKACAFTQGDPSLRSG
jgi:hypothetical protein